MKKKNMIASACLFAFAFVLALAMVLSAGSPAYSADKLQQCIKKCKKPASSTVDYGDAAKWRKQVGAELSYDSCVLQCEKDQFPGGGVWFNTGFKYPSMAGF